MFDRLSNFAKMTSPVSTASFGYTPDPSDLAAMLLAYERYSDTKEFLVGDQLLEKRIIGTLVGLEPIRAAAVYGFEGKLRISIVFAYSGVLGDVDVDIVPRTVEWDGRKSISFTVDVGTVRLRSKVANTAIGVLKSFIREIVPLGGLVSAVGAFSMQRIVRATGLAKLQQHDTLVERGVVWQDNTAIVDLEQQPELKPLFGAVPIPGAGLMAALGAPVRIIDQVTLHSVRVDHDGLLFAATLSPVARAVFEGTTTAAKSAWTAATRLRSPAGEP